MGSGGDLIWDAITDSAKSKIDYAEFEAFFDGLGGEDVPANVLFMIMIGYSNGQSDDDLAEQLQQEFLLIGCVASEEEIRWLLKGKSDALKQETIAIGFAASLLDQDWNERDVMMQVQRVLTA